MLNATIRVTFPSVTKFKSFSTICTNSGGTAVAHVTQRAHLQVLAETSLHSKGPDHLQTLNYSCGLVKQNSTNAEQVGRVNVRRKTYLVRRDCVDLVKTLALHGKSVDATWADFSALIKFATAKSRDGFVRKNCGTTREKQQMRAELINRSALGIRVILWGEAGRLARQFVVLIVESDHVFYVGTTVHKQNTAGYCNEALACLLGSAATRKFLIL
jgi:hypothetical protein